MNRRSVICVLLSLLLLLSQQMAAAHAMSHLAGGRGDAPASAAQQADKRDLSSSFAQDPTCDQCLAFAQLSGTLGSGTRNAIAESNASCEVEHRSNRAAIERTTCHFRSRAPPVLA